MAICHLNKVFTLFKIFLICLISSHAFADFSSYTISLEWGKRQTISSSRLFVPINSSTASALKVLINSVKSLVSLYNNTHNVSMSVGSFSGKRGNALLSYPIGLYFDLVTDKSKLDLRKTLRGCFFYLFSKKLSTSQRKFLVMDVLNNLYDEDFMLKRLASEGDKDAKLFIKYQSFLEKSNFSECYDAKPIADVYANGINFQKFTNKYFRHLDLSKNNPLFKVNQDYATFALLIQPMYKTLVEKNSSTLKTRKKRLKRALGSWMKSLSKRAVDPSWDIPIEMLSTQSLTGVTECAFRLVDGMIEKYRSFARLKAERDYQNNKLKGVLFSLDDLCAFCKPFIENSGNCPVQRLEETFYWVIFKTPKTSYKVLMKYE